MSDAEDYTGADQDAALALVPEAAEFIRERCENGAQAANTRAFWAIFCGYRRVSRVCFPLSV